MASTRNSLTRRSNLTFSLEKSLKPLIVNHWVLAVITVLALLKIMGFLGPKLFDYWERRALLHSWRRLLSFEFWPAPLFYLPIVPYYTFLSLRHRSIYTPFYANPEIENGGLLGESKWEFLKHLNQMSPHTLGAIKIGKQDDILQARELLNKAGFSYPFILKPDIGQRGYGVRIIRDDFDLAEYLRLADFDMIVQKLSRLPCEAGVFYVRHPSAFEGILFSITDKKFPIVTGDGRTRFGDLVLNDKRARIIASTYFSRHRKNLHDIPEDGEIKILAECGNHCQGAIFLNGEKLKTPDLQKSIHSIASQIPDFYFGRFDVRYKNADSLMKGIDFEVIEINGAGSEATHIWDAQATLSEAYGTLFKQWRILFEIGAAVKGSRTINAELHHRRFFRECFKVFFRKAPLSVSS